jgi:hypothetical protein
LREREREREQLLQITGQSFLFWHQQIRKHKSTCFYFISYHLCTLKTMASLCLSTKTDTAPVEKLQETPFQQQN